MQIRSGPPLQVQFERDRQTEIDTDRQTETQRNADPILLCRCNSSAKWTPWKTIPLASISSSPKPRARAGREALPAEEGEEEHRVNRGRRTEEQPRRKRRRRRRMMMMIEEKPLFVLLHFLIEHIFTFRTNVC